MAHLPREHSRTAVAALGRLALLLAASTGLLSAESERHVTAVRFWSLGDVTRVAIETDGQFEVLSDHLSNPERVFFDLTGTKPTLSAKTVTILKVGDKLIDQIRVAEPRKNVTRVVLDLTGVANVNTSRLENPNRLIIEVSQPGHSGKAPAPAAEPPQHRPFVPPPAAPAPPKKAVALLDPPAIETKPVMSAALKGKLAAPAMRAATVPVIAYSNGANLPREDRSEPAVAAKRASEPELETASLKRTEAPAESMTQAKHAPATASDTKTSGGAALPAKRNSTGDRSMIRVLGLKVGRIVLDAGHGGHDTGTVGPEGLKEKDLVLDVAKRLGALIEDRMGSEVIYTRSDDTFIPLERRTEIANEAKADLFLSIHANSSPFPSAVGVETYYLSFTTSKTALDLAARENAGSQESVFDLQNLLQKIALNDKIGESRDFAARVQTAMFALSAKNNAKSKDRGTKKAPFVVLIGANMPSVLSEIGFISNAHDERVMKKPEYRDRIAEALYKGVSGYAATLSHFQVAQRHPSSSE